MGSESEAQAKAAGPLLRSAGFDRSSDDDQSVALSASKASRAIPSIWKEEEDFLSRSN